MGTVNIDPWLPQVAKPSRYTDHEINSVHKSWQPVNFCFAYPDVYEVGVSHLGLKILYSIVNSLAGTMADRCYLPWLDLIDIMRRERIPLFGLESRRPLQDFDLIGITLQSELTYSNILELLDLAGLPVLAGDRGAEDPIVMAGGPCATNPLPLVPFIDVFFIGEAEEAIIEIARVFHDYAGKEERLAGLARIEGCFVPRFHQRLADPSLKVKARKFSGFDSGELTHTPQLLSWQLATHNRCVSEIMRGCSRGCRFCHAGYFYRPVRERPAEQIRDALLREITSSGWDEAGLLSLSSSDYSCLKDLLFSLVGSLDTDKTHVSLPSLRVDSLDDETVELMRKLGREGLTIAPEAGSQRLRDVINKNLTEEQILDGVRTALDLGWQKVKLYFMIGLPTETEEDIEGIIDLILKISASGGKRLQVNVTLSPFVPKPFTPFQWAGMLTPAELLRRCLVVKQAFSRRNQIKIKYHTIETSVLEAIFSRGGEHAGKLLLQAWQMGARFDGWNECFDFGLWEGAAKAAGLSLQDLLAERNPAEKQAWEFIDTGVTHAFLLSEWNKALRAETTADCRETCSQCGVCGPGIQTVYAPPAVRVDGSPAPPQKVFSSSASLDQHRFRVTYSKTGILRFISHLDWMRMLFRLISKAPLDTVYTQGFSPHPKVSLCPPLPLGVESNCEFFDLSFYQRYTSEEITAKLSQSRIPQFQVLKAEILRSKPLLPVGESISVEIPEAYQESVKREIDLFALETEHLFTKSTQTRSKDYDLKRIIHSIEWDGNHMLIHKSLASPALYHVLSELLQLDRSVLYQFRTLRDSWIF